MPQAAPAYTCEQHQDRIHLRTQCENLCYRLLNAVAVLDGLPIGTEGNQTFAAVRDMLSDMLQYVQDCTPISQGVTDVGSQPESIRKNHDRG